LEASTTTSDVECGCTHGEVAIVVTRRGRPEVLLVRRIPEFGGYWHVIAGGIEQGESAVQAAERELREETGLLTHVGSGVSAREFVHAPTGEPADRDAQHDPSVVCVIVECFHVVAPPGWQPKLNHEHDAHRWCPPHEALRVLRWSGTAQALAQILPSA